MPQILSTRDAAQLLCVPAWRLDDAVRRGEVAPSLFSGNRVWLADDVERVRAALSVRGIATSADLQADARLHDAQLRQRDANEQLADLKRELDALGASIRTLAAVHDGMKLVAEIREFRRRLTAVPSDDRALASADGAEIRVLGASRS